MTVFDPFFQERLLAAVDCISDLVSTYCITNVKLCYIVIFACIHSQSVRIGCTYFRR